MWSEELVETVQLTALPVLFEENAPPPKRDIAVVPEPSLLLAQNVPFMLGPNITGYTTTGSIYTGSAGGTDTTIGAVTCAFSEKSLAKITGTSTWTLKLLFDASNSNSYYVDSAIPTVRNVPCYALIKA